ncbi:MULTISPECIES: SMI1/KNR4 family protein [Pseudomonas]|uniref:SMI1/KNR4 family protein n=1 Tax=Pseudomonas quercus TaxID=2722792 RepID=A0ABX0YLN2_9PSED|nr:MULTISPECIES: SMI1/KNR4 family protein [Pseudomonas]MBF7144344.1 SMI1/KNR4 family protein [Pseudomonas sp. LY10J]NJP02883.1 SMI1/KNR4 family protein [Pseudomonas quercus]
MEFIWTETRPPAKANAIESALLSLGVGEDSWLAEFWRLHDGAFLNDLVLIYSTADILEQNENYQIASDFPGYYLMGDDSGGRLLLVKKDCPEKFFIIDAGDPFIDESEGFLSFEALIESLITGTQDESDLGDIISLGAEHIGNSEVLFLKKNLGVSDSITNLKAKLNKRDEVVCRNVNLTKYRRVLEAYSKFIKFSNSAAGKNP